MPRICAVRRLRYHFLTKDRLVMPHMHTTSARGPCPGRGMRQPMRLATPTYGPRSMRAGTKSMAVARAVMPSLQCQCYAELRGAPNVRGFWGA